MYLIVNELILWLLPEDHTMPVNIILNCKFKKYFKLTNYFKMSLPELQSNFNNFKAPLKTDRAANFS